MEHRNTMCFTLAVMLSATIVYFRSGGRNL